jgi:AcrR family transcriptional regulator
MYRHFPTRQDLVKAVYRSELDALTNGVNDLLEAHPALDALRTWMGRYAQFVAAKRAMYDAIRMASASSRDRQRIREPGSLSRSPPWLTRANRTGRYDVTSSLRISRSYWLASF